MHIILTSSQNVATNYLSRGYLIRKKQLGENSVVSIWHCSIADACTKKKDKNSRNHLSKFMVGGIVPCRCTDVIVKLKNGLSSTFIFLLSKKKRLKWRKCCFCMLLHQAVLQHSQYTSMIPNCRGYLLLYKQHTLGRIQLLIWKLS